MNVKHGIAIAAIALATFVGGTWYGATGVLADSQILSAMPSIDVVAIDPPPHAFLTARHRR